MAAGDLAGFDAAVIATGSTGLRHGWTMLRPEKWGRDPLPGADLDHVMAYTDLLASDPDVGKRAVVFDTMGGRQGAVTAEYLAQRGARVFFVTQLGQPSPDLAFPPPCGSLRNGILCPLWFKQRGSSLATFPQVSPWEIPGQLKTRLPQC